LAQALSVRGMGAWLLLLWVTQFTPAAADAQSSGAAHWTAPKPLLRAVPVQAPHTAIREAAAPLPIEPWPLPAVAVATAAAREPWSLPSEALHAVAGVAALAASAVALAGWASRSARRAPQTDLPAAFCELATVPLVVRHAAERSPAPRMMAPAPCMGQMSPTARTNPVLAYDSGGQLVLERAPPAPPKTPPRGGGGGGGGDGESYFLRLLKESEPIEVLSDWIGRSRIYSMSDAAEIARSHEAAVKEMEELKEFAGEVGRSERWAHRKMVLAYVDQDDKVHALAGAMVSAIDGLLVHYVVVHPAELNNQDSTAWSGLKHGLELLATAINVKLDSTVISEEPQPICMRISRAREDSDPVPMPRRDLGELPPPPRAREWTRWASRARELDAALEAAHFALAAKIQAEFNVLSAEDDAILNDLAAKIEAATSDEDYGTAAMLNAELDTALKLRARP